MSYRPITQAEARRGVGAPFSDALSLFGLTQGVLVFLHHNKLALKSQWFASNPVLVPVFFAYCIGGMAAGMAGGYFIFGDAGLRRLDLSHKNDSTLTLGGQQANLIQ